MKSESRTSDKKPAGKSPAKGLGSRDKKKSRSHTRHSHSFRTSIKRLIKGAHSSPSGAPPQVSGPVVESLCNIVCDVIERIAVDCATLARKANKHTINYEEVVHAAALNLTGELNTNAKAEIDTAIAKTKNAKSA
ncbi:histone H2B [Nematocida sp. AWRm77]|nr:histone H2B [Nematocida sp. AWRm77]